MVNSGCSRAAVTEIREAKLAISSQKVLVWIEIEKSGTIFRFPGPSIFPKGHICSRGCWFLGPFQDENQATRGSALLPLFWGKVSLLK